MRVFGQFNRIASKAAVLLTSVQVFCIGALASPPAANLITAPLVSPQSAWSYYNQSGQLNHTNGVAARVNVPEIVELARSLGGGRLPAAQFVQNAYDYVHNNIETEFRFGLGKGGFGALVDQSGTSFDQAELLVNILRQGGIPATYQVGTIALGSAFTVQQFGQWTGVITNLIANSDGSQSFVVDAHQACQFLADGGIPAVVNGQGDCSQVSGPLTSLEMAHIWVVANNYAYDPSLKLHQLRSGIDLSMAMGCGTAASPTCGGAMVAAAMNGATTGTDASGPYIKNLNDTRSGGLNAQLQSYAVALQNYIQINNRTALLQDIVGGPVLIAETGTAPVAALPYAATAVGTWSREIPDAYRTTLRVRVGANNNAYYPGWNGGPADQFFYADEIAGRRLQALPGKVFKIDATSVTGADCTSCTQATVILDISHPYAAPSNYADEEVVLPMPGDGNGFTSSTEGTYPITIILGLGNQSQNTELHMAAFEESNPNRIGTETIASSSGNLAFRTYTNRNQSVTTAKFLAEGSQAETLIAGMGKARITRHHAIGIAYAGVFDPGQVNYFSVQSAVSVNTNSSDGVMRNPVFEAEAATWASLEGEVNAQVQNTRTGLSTITYMQCGNAMGGAFHLTTNALPGYNLITGEPASCGGGGKLYFSPDSVSYAILLNGQLIKGGGTLQTDPLHQALESTKIDETASTRKKYLTVSPSDGSALLTATDLASGTGKFPETLPFRRTYKSGASVSEVVDSTSWDIQNNFHDGDSSDSSSSWLYSGPDTASNSHLGGGWTHNYDITATDNTNAYKAFGSETGLDAAMPITALWSFMDAARNMQAGGTPVINSRLAMSFDVFWMVQSLAYNSVVINKGGATEAFQRLPDGSFSSATNSSRLVQFNEPTFVGQPNFLNVSFRLTGHNGDVISFVNSHQSTSPYGIYGSSTPQVGDPIFSATSWGFPDGTALTFSYTTQILLKNWGSAFPTQCNILTGSCTGTIVTSMPIGMVLTQVSNNRGRSLTFTNVATTVAAGATDGMSVTQVSSRFRISQVADETGRSVSFGTPNCQSITCPTFAVTEPDSAVAKYTYNASAVGVESSTYQMSGYYVPSDQSTPYEKLNYDSVQRVASVSDKLSHTTFYYPGSVAHTEIWKRSDVVDALGNTETSIFDQWDSLLSTTDPLLRTKTTIYDNARRKVLETNPEGDSVAFSYDVRSNVLTTTNHAKPGAGLSDIGASTTYLEGPAVQSCSNPVTCNSPVTDTNGNSVVTRYTWDGVTGLPTSIENGFNATGTCLLAGGLCARVDAIYANYDGLKLLSSMTKRISSSQSETTSFTYDPANHYVLASANVDPNGLNLTTTLAHDSVGNLTQVDGPRTDVADISNYTWDIDRRLTMAIEPGVTDNGNSHPRIATKYTYDVDGQLTQTNQGTTTSATGSDFVALLTKMILYDPVGNKIQETTPTSVTQYSYDVDDHALCTAVRMNTTKFGSLPTASFVNTGDTSTAPDACALGTVASNGDQDRITMNVYDAASLLRQIVRGYGSSAQQVYETIKYSPNGKQIALADADQVSTIGVASADALNAAAVTQHQTNYVYDGFDRLVQTIYADGSGDQITQYDNDNNPLTKLTRAGQTLAFTYDALDRMATKAVPAVANVSAANTVKWSYDLTSKVTAIWDTLGNNLSNCYDLAGRQTSATSSTSGTAFACGSAPANTATTRTVGYQVDQAGNRTQLTWPDGYFVTYGYDAANRMTAANENGSMALAIFDYESLGRPVWRQYPAGAANDKVTYAWTPESDLLSLSHKMNGTVNDVSYRYLRDDLTTPGYNSAHQNTDVQIDNQAYKYVPSDGGATNYASNGLNQYSAAGGQGIGYDLNGNLTSDGNFAYTYDPESHLMTAAKAGQAVAYAYDPLGRRTAKMVNSTATYFLNSGDDEIAEFDGSGNLLRRYVPGPGVDQPIAMVTAAGVKSFFHQDKTGSVIAMTDVSGNLAEGPYTYDPFGNCLAGGQACSIGVPYRYTGRRLDPETGLYYYRARYYSASLGHFLQTDPIGYKDDLNWYAYVGNDPTNKTDPLGLYDCSGNKSDCGAVNQFVTTINQSLAGLDPKSDAYAKVSAVASYLGKAGHNNGVTINPTSLGGSKLATAGQNGTINVDVGKISKISTAYGAANPGMSGTGLRNATGAGAIAHEGRHERDFQRLWHGNGPSDKAQEYRTEENAYRTQAGVWEGLGLRTGLWHPGMTSQQEDQQISGYAQKSTDCWAGGSCGP